MKLHGVRNIIRQWASSVEVRDPPPVTYGTGGRPIYGTRTSHAVQAVLLPPTAMFSDQLGVSFEDWGAFQSDELWMFVLDPLVDESGVTVAIQELNEETGMGSQVVFRNEVYNVVAEAYAGQVDVGVRYYVLRRVR